MKKRSVQLVASLPESFTELVRLLPPRAIYDHVDYRNTQDMIDRLTSLSRLTSEQDHYLDTLATLLHAYEQEHHAIATNDLPPVEMLRFLMEQRGMNAGDLGRLLDERTRGEKVLRGDRELTKAEIRILADYFKVNPGLFL